MKPQILLRLISLIAHHRSEADGDELLIKHDNKRIWPKTEKYFRANDLLIIPVDTNILIKCAGWVYLDLFEYDNFFSGSLLGTFKIYIESSPPLMKKFEASFSSSGNVYANYGLNWEIINAPSKSKIQ